MYESVRNVLTLLNDKIEIYEKVSECSITTGLNFYQSIKEGLLIGKEIIWLGQVYHIEFNRDDYNLIDTEMSYGSEDIYYDVWLEIEWYGRKIAEFRLSPQQEFALDILDYEYENFGQFIDSLVEFLKGVNYQKEYTDIFDTLSCLQDNVLKIIGDVTIL